MSTVKSSFKIQCFCFICSFLLNEGRLVADSRARTGLYEALELSLKPITLRYITRNSFKIWFRVKKKKKKVLTCSPILAPGHWILDWLYTRENFEGSWSSLSETISKHELLYLLLRLQSKGFILELLLRNLFARASKKQFWAIQSKDLSCVGGLIFISRPERLFP